MQKTKTGKEAEQRNEQFEKIKRLREKYGKEGNPVISVDVKKELIDDFYREGRRYCTKALQVYDHDFPSQEQGMIITHGIYDIKRNGGYITLGVSHDTSEFNCECIKQWWEQKGKQAYPQAISLLILVDGGGSNSSRHYIFKEDLQKIANEMGIEIRIAHYPPYTSKYNPIEHKLFCHVTRACAGAVFSSLERAQELMQKTSTSTGLKVVVSLQKKTYQITRKVQKHFKKSLPIIFDEWLGKWNYRAVPHM